MTSPRPLIALALGLALTPTALAAEGKVRRQREGAPRESASRDSVRDPSRDAPRNTSEEGAEHARLQREIDQQRSLLRKLAQQQKEQAEQLLRALGKERSGDASATLALEPLISGATEPVRPAVPEATHEPARASVALPTEAPHRPARPERTDPKPRGVGVLSGRLSLQSERPTDAVVYIADVRGKPSKDNVLVIHQVNKQFQPRVAVVPRGTRLELPNDDSIFHNAFSLSPGNSFDLGTYRAGDQPGAVTLSVQGVVKIFCNLHSQMTASVLVVPNAFYAQVKADGTFRIEGVPPGKHQLAAWSPNTEPVMREVEVQPGDNAPVSFSLGGKAGQAHTNKFGQPYGSYAE